MANTIYIMHLRDIWYYFCRYFLILLSDRQFNILVRWIHGKRLGYNYYLPNLEKPKTFNEHILDIKTSKRPTIGQEVADKVTVRKYVAEKIGKTYLIPLIGIYKNASKVPIEKLPNAFALKTNHGSGWNLIVYDKSKLNWHYEKKRLNQWLKRNAYYLSREWQYKNISAQIICEELLAYEIKDYKFFCVDGKVKAIQVDTDRFSKHKRNLYDVQWNLLDIQFIYPNTETPILKPTKFNEMIVIAEKLAASFVFCRIDLYVHNEKIYFGEVTLHPEGGNGYFKNYSQDLAFADLLGLNNRKY